MNEHNIPPWPLTGEGELRQDGDGDRGGDGAGEAQLSRLQTVLPTSVRTHASPARRVQGLTQGGAVGSCNTLYSSRGKGSIEPLNSLSGGWAIGLHLLNREDLFFRQTALCTGPCRPGAAGGDTGVLRLEVGGLLPRPFLGHRAPPAASSPPSSRRKQAHQLPIQANWGV